MYILDNVHSIRLIIKTDFLSILATCNNLLKTLPEGLINILFSVSSLVLVESTINIILEFIFPSPISAYFRVTDKLHFSQDLT
jgi:hypothetical protein